jgi:hypothetical protein
MAATHQARWMRGDRPVCGGVVAGAVVTGPSCPFGGGPAVAVCVVCRSDPAVATTVWG